MVGCARVVCQHSAAANAAQIAVESFGELSYVRGCTDVMNAGLIVVAVLEKADDDSSTHEVIGGSSAALLEVVHSLASA